MQHFLTLITFVNNEKHVLAEVYKGKKGFKVVMAASSFWVKSIEEV